MKTYNEFLLENYLWEGTKRLTEEEAIEIAKTKCSDFIKIERNVTITRDVDLEDTIGYIEYAYVNPVEYERRSANTKNYYTLIMNNDTSWQDYPKRKLICSLYTYDDELRDYKVLPYNDTKWGVCMATDLWWSFPEIEEYDISKLKNFNDYLHFIAKYLRVKIDDNNLEVFKKSLKLIDKGLKKKEEKGETIEWKPDTGFSQKEMEKNIVHMANQILEQGGAYQFLVNTLNPDENGFSVVTVNDLNSVEPLDDSNEVWTDGECLLIHKDSYEEFINKVRNEKV